MLGGCLRWVVGAASEVWLWGWIGKDIGVSVGDCV